MGGAAPGTMQGACSNPQRVLIVNSAQLEDAPMARHGPSATPYFLQPTFSPVITAYQELHSTNHSSPTHTAQAQSQQPPV